MSGRRSMVWNHFTDTDTPGRMLCNYCRQNVTVSRNSTGNLMRHLTRHPEVNLLKDRPKPAPLPAVEGETYYLIESTEPKQKIKKSTGSSTANSDSEHTTDPETRAAVKTLKVLVNDDENVVDTSTTQGPTLRHLTSFASNTRTVRSSTRPTSRRQMPPSGGRWRYVRRSSPAPRRRSPLYRSRRHRDRSPSPEYSEPEESFKFMEEERWKRDNEREIERNELRERELVIQERQIETTIRWQQIAERALDMMQTYLDRRD